MWDLLFSRLRSSQGWHCGTSTGSTAHRGWHICKSEEQGTWVSAPLSPSLCCLLFIRMHSKGFLSADKMESYFHFEINLGKKNQWGLLFYFLHFGDTLFLFTSGSRGRRDFLNIKANNSIKGLPGYPASCIPPFKYPLAPSLGPSSK